MPQSLSKVYVHIIFSTKNRQNLIDYIQSQHEHHKHKSFQDEFRAFLKKYKVKYASPSASLAPPLKLQRHADGDRWMNDMCGIRLTPFQGLDLCYTRFTGRCPVFLLMPFQGKKEDK